jgi:small-conductance mechanosensitive channel
MKITQTQIIEAVFILIIYLILKLITNRYVDKVVSNNVSAKARGKIIRKAMNLTLVLVFLIILLSIFGINQSELLVFIGSVLTVIGIALFAQWSILSNITSGIIIFFNRTVKLEDTIRVLDKEYDIEGVISDIGLFFVIIKTKDNEQICIPNRLFFDISKKSRFKFKNSGWIFSSC